MELTDFPQSLPVDIESCPLFFEAYRNSPPAVADQVFNSIFGWQEQFDYRVSRREDFVLVFHRDGNRLIFLPPLLWKGTLRDAGWGERFLSMVRSVDGYCRQNGLEAVFRDFPEHYLRYIPQTHFTVVPERDSFDYIYRKDDLVRLAGQKYAAKRNLIKQFMRNYHYRYEPLAENNLACVYRFIRHWEPAAGAGARDIASGEYRMIYRLMKNYDSLTLCGGILFVENKEVAATVATVVPDFTYADGVFPTVVVHSEHALLEYKGSYQMINQLFCSSLSPDVVYVDREEDLGVPGLRKAKLSYGPERLLEKSRLVLV
jgi:hypothetical protein